MLKCKRNGALFHRLHGLILLDGPGLADGGTASKSPYSLFIDRLQAAPPEPSGIADLDTDARSPACASNDTSLASHPTPFAEAFQATMVQPAA